MNAGAGGEGEGEGGGGLKNDDGGGEAEGATDSSGRGINYIIRHDCHVSVRAAFKEMNDDDLSDLYFMYIYIGLRRFPVVSKMLQVDVLYMKGMLRKKLDDREKCFYELSFLYIIYIYIQLYIFFCTFSFH